MVKADCGCYFVKINEEVFPYPCSGGGGAYYFGGDFARKLIKKVKNNECILGDIEHRGEE